MVKLILNKKEIKYLKENGYTNKDITSFKKKNEHEIGRTIFFVKKK